MIDIQLIRDDPEKVQQNARNKGYEVDISHIATLDEKHRALLQKVEGLRHQRNDQAQEFKKTKPSSEQIETGKKLKDQISELDAQLETSEKELRQSLAMVPNMAWEDVPIGTSEADNVVIKTVGDKPSFDFESKNHWQLGQMHDWIDKERAVKVAGARFVYLKGDLVLLEFALWQFALHQLTSQTVIEQIVKDNKLQVSPKPFTPVLPPAMARTVVYEATGRLNKEEQTYKLADDELWLNASAEHTLSPMYLDEILEEADFPIRYVGYTTAFRREAGTYGKDTEGMFRLHQFNKLEMESFNLPENSFQEHLLMIAIQEYLMQCLGLPYRVLNKCSVDIGGPNARGVDIDVWLPGQNKYRETHTADYITDYQARRMQTRVRRNDGRVELVHTNDATALSQRPMIAILENYQQADGSVIIPKVLQPIMNKEVIGESRD